MYLSKTNDGSPYRIVGVCHSIQEHKNTEDKLRAARNKAQESDRLKSAFIDKGIYKTVSIVIWAIIAY